MEDSKTYRLVWRIVLPALLFFAITCCFCKFGKWSEIPTHSIKANLYVLGESENRHCTYRMRINAGGSNPIINDSNFQNSIIIYDSTIDVKDFKQYKIIENKFKDTYRTYKDNILNKNRFYILDYSLSTTINVVTNKSDSRFKHNNYTFCYIDTPRWEKKCGKSFISGSGFLALPKIGGKGGGNLNFSTNLTNEAPKMTSLWDITQGNYDIQIKCQDIRCDTISIEFYGAANFSNMYPRPQKTTMSGIEFTDSADIHKILKDGLRFHADFIELKEMSAKRTFILTAILSLFISIFANVIFMSIYGKK